MTKIRSRPVARGIAHTCRGTTIDKEPNKLISLLSVHAMNLFKSQTVLHDIHKQKKPHELCCLCHGSIVMFSSTCCMKPIV